MLNANVCILKGINLNNKIYKILIVMLGSILIALSAQITIPLLPVPVTLQTFAISLIGAIFGPKIGTLMVLLYLLEGIIGFPVFANFSYGTAVIFGPTGGYLIGFIFAVSLTGYLLNHGWVQSRMRIFFALFFGHVTLFISGYLILASFVGYSNAYLFGVAPFYLVEIVKLLLLTIIIPLYRNR